MEPSEALDRGRTESRIMADIAGLAASEYDYPDMIQVILDLVEQVVSSPFLSLIVEESGQVGQYTRVGQDVDRLWAEDVERQVAETQWQQLARGAGAVQRPIMRQGSLPNVWIAAFPAWIRSGRRGALILGCPEPLSMRPEEEEVMVRLARQVLLVLDHALLLQQLESVEVLDGLTGIANHRRLLEILDYEMQRHRYLERRLGLLLLDVEGLDGINRIYGRSYGDHILSKVAGLLRAAVRPIDVVARSGMDEFAVVLPESDEAAANDLAEQVRSSVLAMGFAGGTVELTVGLTHVKPDETMSAEGFLRRGEQVIHEAKRSWREIWLAERPPAPR
jgi:diguanylate cyclase (GGDEF)-like protein